MCVCGERKCILSTTTVTHILVKRRNKEKNALILIGLVLANLIRFLEKQHLYVVQRHRERVKNKPGFVAASAMSTTQAKVTETVTSCRHLLAVHGKLFKIHSLN